MSRFDPALHLPCDSVGVFAAGAPARTAAIATGNFVEALRFRPVGGPKLQALPPSRFVALQAPIEPTVRHEAAPLVALESVETTTSRRARHSILTLRLSHE